MAFYVSAYSLLALTVGNWLITSKSGLSLPKYMNLSYCSFGKWFFADAAPAEVTEIVPHDMVLRAEQSMPLLWCRTASITCTR